MGGVAEGIKGSDSAEVEVHVMVYWVYVVLTRYTITGIEKEREAFVRRTVLSNAK